MGGLDRGFDYTVRESLQFSVTQHHINAPSGVISLSRSIPGKKIKKRPPGKERGKKKIPESASNSLSAHRLNLCNSKTIYCVVLHKKQGGRGERKNLKESPWVVCLISTSFFIYKHQLFLPVSLAGV